MEREPLAHRDPELLLDEVDVPDQLGHRMFDLKPGVHLEEEERSVLIDDELARPGADVADRGRERDRRFAHARPRRGIDGRRRALLDHLLVPALGRAVALAERPHRAVPVGEDLDFDVPRALDRAFEDEALVAEGRSRGPSCARQRVGQVGLTGHELYADAAAAPGRLQ